MDTTHDADINTGKVDATFEERKRDHLEHALHPGVQATELRDIDSLTLQHEALPDLDFSEVVTDSDFFGRPSAVPLFISSMTAGHAGSLALNQLLAQSAQDLGWAMGVGSQRRQLFDGTARAEWRELRKAAPEAILFGNLGIAQLIETTGEQVQELADSIEATAFFVHLNPLQECLQREGTPDFKGGLKAIEKLCAALEIPVIIKETGCGFGPQTLARLKATGVAAIDVSGAGGTHWGRVEGARNGPVEGARGSRTEGAQEGRDDLYHQAAKTYGRWGIGTVESLHHALKLGMGTANGGLPLWASGGVRNGLDAAKLIAFGADKVGFAQAALATAVQGEGPLHAWMQRMEFELRIALFCTGAKNPQELQNKKVCTWNSRT